MYVVYLIYTGGTISADIKSTGTGLVAGVEKSILSKLKLQTFQDFIFKEINAYNILSENLEHRHLEILKNTLDKIEDAAKIIILTGTDHLTYLGKYLLLGQHSKKLITLIGSQRSPEMPCFEGVRKLELVLSGYKKGLIASVYIANYINHQELAFLDPFTTLKLEVYKKRCFYGSVNYTLLTTSQEQILIKGKKPHKYLNKNVAKPIRAFSSLGFLNSELVDFNLTLPQNVSHVLVNSTGLCNISDACLRFIKEKPTVKFYIVNNLYGLKYQIYAPITLDNVFVKQENIEYAYLRLLYDEFY